MITDEMVEAAAKVIWDAENGVGDYDRIRQKMPDVMKSPKLALNITARAALEAAERAAAHPFDGIVARAKAAAAKASVKFPQPNYVALKIAEEAGEVVRGCVHYAENRMEWAEVEGEIVQLVAMLIRLVTEGDQINGVFPPTPPEAA